MNDITYFILNPATSFLFRSENQLSPAIQRNQFTCMIAGINATVPSEVSELDELNEKSLATQTVKSPIQIPNCQN
jgi:hypothetical protein